MKSHPPPAADEPARASRLARTLDVVERLGNRLPDPAVLFLLALVVTWLLSWLLSGVNFAEIDPRTGVPLVVYDQLSGSSLVAFLAEMVRVFVSFPPLGVVLVAMLGIGVAEHSGFINAALRGLLSATRKGLLTPMVVLVGIISHMAVDAGYVLVIPLGGAIFHAAGRHPLAGIAAAFAGVSGGFSATILPSSLDPLLQGLTEAAARVLDPEISLNPLNNYFFTTLSSVPIILLGWLVTDKFVEPRLAQVTLDGDLQTIPPLTALERTERRALLGALVALALGALSLVATALPESSPWRAPESGQLAHSSAPLMQSIVALIFVLFLIPGIVFGYLSGSVKTHRDIISAMSRAMSGMGYYVVLAFFAAQFIAAFGKSNLGALLALKGALALQALSLPVGVTILGIIGMTGLLNLLIGSASAKWALLAPIFVPMLMQLGISPDLTQAAYRVGDSTTTVITPLMPYFPLIVVFCQRYVKGTGIGTLVALMLPYSVFFFIGWTLFLLAYWALGLPLGLTASYTYP